MNPIKFFSESIYLHNKTFFSGSFKPASFAAKSRLNTSRAISWLNKDLPKQIFWISPFAFRVNSILILGGSWTSIVLIIWSPYWTSVKCRWKRVLFNKLENSRKISLIVDWLTTRVVVEVVVVVDVVVVTVVIDL